MNPLSKNLKLIINNLNRNLILKSESLRGRLNEFNNFYNNDAIQKFSNSSDIINKLLERCLKNNFQDFAM